MSEYAMALDVRRLEPGEERRLHVVAKATAPSTRSPEVPAEEFVFPPNNRAVRVRRPAGGSRRRILGLVLVLCVAAGVAFFVRTRAEPEESPEPARSAALAAGAPAPAPTTASGTPMSIVSSSLAPATGQTYRASVSVLNPTDVTASDVRVRVTVKDATGNVVGTDARMLDVLPSGHTAKLDFTGELYAGGARPAALDVQAVAARLVSAGA